MLFAGAAPARQRGCGASSTARAALQMCAPVYRSRRRGGGGRGRGTSVARARRRNAAVSRRICFARCCATCICARAAASVRAPLSLPLLLCHAEPGCTCAGGRARSRAGACDAHAPRHAHARRPGCACAPQRAGRRAARHAGLHAREGVLAAVETRGQEVAPQALCAHARCHYAVRCARRTAPGRPPPQAALLASTAGCSACEQLFCLSHAAGTSGSKHAAVQES